mmetsp:Transcript_5093/g.15485  ORF Transcript_5093/g.15485 Transcript_5093/m.15485 type:complete len:239 (-) Transcript_5093:33-749(-)
MRAWPNRLLVLRHRLCARRCHLLALRCRWHGRPRCPTAACGCVCARLRHAVVLCCRCGCCRCSRLLALAQHHPGSLPSCQRCSRQASHKVHGCMLGCVSLRWVDVRMRMCMGPRMRMCVSLRMGRMLVQPAASPHAEFPHPRPLCIRLQPPSVHAPPRTERGGAMGRPAPPPPSTPLASGAWPSRRPPPKLPTMLGWSRRGTLPLALHQQPRSPLHNIVGSDTRMAAPSSAAGALGTT